MNVDILEHSEHCHRVHSRDNAGKQQVFLQVDILNAERLDLADTEERDTDANRVPQGPHDRKPHHRANILKKGPSGHEVRRIQNEGRQHVEEEDTGGEDSWGLLVYRVHDTAHYKPNSNQQAGLWYPYCNFMVHMETCF